MLRHIDCTPPADLPDVVIVQDPKYGFWIRVTNETGGSDCPHEGYLSTLPGARGKARELGYEPGAWVDATGNIIRF